MPELQSRIVTFLFTDVEGSTRLWEENQEAMSVALARHDELLGGAIAVKYDAHVRMSTLSDRLAQISRAGRLWDRVIRLSPVAVGSILLVLGVRIVEISMRRELPTLEISAGYFNTVVPLSGALMIFYAVRGFLRRR